MVDKLVELLAAKLGPEMVVSLESKSVEQKVG
jgi:hypothetical protein